MRPTSGSVHAPIPREVHAPHGYDFSAAHRGGQGEPMLLLHGFTGIWRAWELVLGELERHHDVLAPTLAGHAGGPPLREPSAAALLGEVERAMDAAGFDTAHLVGNSLGGHLALALAALSSRRSGSDAADAP